MHKIQLYIYKFLEEVKKGGYKIPRELLKKFSEGAQEALVKQFEHDPRNFKLSMSNIGRPICQLQFESLGYKNNIDPIRNIYGYMVEELLMFLIKASGLKVVSEQERVSLTINDATINGVLDLILDLDDGYHTVWDIKSASNWAFKNKFLIDGSFNKLLYEDPYGYGIQLLLYTMAKGLELSGKQANDKPIRAGGFIAFDKSSGEIGITEVPREQDSFFRYAIEFCDRQSKILSGFTARRVNVREKTITNTPPEKVFSLIEETFNKTLTGNKYLCPTCEMCSFKYPCWGDLKYIPQPNSKSKNPKFRYYKELKSE